MFRPTINADWKKLLLVNYSVDPGILEPFLPYKTKLALWDGMCYVSLVGFLFLKVRLVGIPVPFHTNFVEINLRFYVRRAYKDEWRYGVVFLKEIVALPMVTFIANKIAKENYDTMPAWHKIINTTEDLFIQYQWKKKEWHGIEIHCDPQQILITENSDEDFLTTQHWGYSRVNDHKTYEYSVAHPKWKMYKTKEFGISVDYAKVFGHQFGFLKQQQPESTFLVEGSPIFMRKEKTITLRNDGHLLKR